MELLPYNHPVRRAARHCTSTWTRKIATGLVLLSGTGAGTTVLAPNTVPGQMGHQVVRVVQYEVNKLTGTTDTPLPPARRAPAVQNNN